MTEQIEFNVVPAHSLTVDESTAPNMSMVSRLVCLEVGSSESISRRLDLDRVDHQTLTETTKALRNIMSGAVGRATKRVPYNYAIETTKAMTRTDDIIVTATATRIS